MARRRFNVLRAKRLVMGVSALVLGLWSALSGITAQTATQSYIEFMLGYNPLKAGATAALFAFAVSGGTVIGWLSLRPNTLTLPLGAAVWLAAGATLGALVLYRLSQRAPLVRRVGRGLVILLCVFVVSEGTRSRFTGLPQLNWDWSYGALAAGFVAGAAGQLLALPTGVFLVPAAVFALGMPPALGILVALLVAAFAAVIPASGIILRSTGDREVGPFMYVAGGCSGVLGGWILASRTTSQSTWPLAVFGITAMLLSAWLAYKES